MKKKTFSFPLGQTSANLDATSFIPNELANYRINKKYQRKKTLIVFQEKNF